MNRYDDAWRRLKQQQATTPPGHGLPLFDGVTIGADDEPRLTGQLDKVYGVMRDGQWHTLAELAAAAQGSEAGVSARIRDLRKPRFGQHAVERRRRDEGNQWEYRLVGAEKAA